MPAIRLRRGTAALWTSRNPTLSEGEEGHETDTGKRKVGDGSTAWNSLAYFQTPTATKNVNTQTNDYTPVLGDADDIIVMNKATGNTVTIPTNASVAFPVGTEIEIIQFGAGTTSVSASGGVTLNSAGGVTNIRVRYGVAKLVKIDTDSWIFDPG